MKVCGIEFDRKIVNGLKLADKTRIGVTRPYFDAENQNVVCTDGHIMLVQKVENTFGVKSGFITFPDDELGTGHDYGKLKDEDESALTVDSESEVKFPNYLHAIPENDKVMSFKEFKNKSFTFVSPTQVVDGKLKKGALVIRKCPTGCFVDEKLLKLCTSFFDDLKRVSVFYDEDDLQNPLKFVSGNKMSFCLPNATEVRRVDDKTAVLMPIFWDYGDEAYIVEGRKILEKVKITADL